MKRETLDELIDFGEASDYDRLELPSPRRGADGSLAVEAAALEALAERAFSGIAFRLPIEEAAALGGIASDSRGQEAGGPSDADRFVACELLRNAAIAAEGVYPLCQDTGTALVFGWKGALVDTAVDGDEEASDEEILERGAARAYDSRRLRKSQLEPTDFLGERNSGDNMPLLADIRVAGGAHAAEYRLCFSAKGGGSANRTVLSMESPALLDEASLEARIKERITSLGASGCPPYRLALVLGGQGPDESLRALALASLGLLDTLPDRAPGDGSRGAAALRDRDWEARMLALAGASGVGAQFGGTALALAARAIRLPRHAASLPLATGVACAAHRKARAIVSEAGFFLERLEADPGRFLPARAPILPEAKRVDLDRPQRELAAELAALEPGSFLLLSGTVITARDKAHARFRELIASGAELPRYLFEHPVFYAGPTEAAPGNASGSFGPTTSGRMDGYMDELVSRGASLVSIAKGGRSKEAAQAIGSGGGAYLACIGGAAALAGREHVLSSEVIDYPELGMEAVRRVALRELPAMLVVDGKGRDFYALLKGRQ
jgi:Tartrate dehydratase beta subunit/Fumarate hydratase class I, C-terminal domain